MSEMFKIIEKKTLPNKDFCTNLIMTTTVFFIILEKNITISFHTHPIFF